jgi:hypothetical protein
VLALCLSLALAAEPSPTPAPVAADPVADALTTELKRLAAGLSLPDAGPPWLIRAELTDVDDVSAWGGRGALFEHDATPLRELHFEVRVGSEQVDNTNFGSPWDDDGLGTTRLVDSLAPDAVRRDLWITVDDAYKDAVAALGRREAARRRQERTDHPPSYAPGEVERGAVADPGLPDVDEAAVDALVREASRGWRDAAWVLGAVKVRAQHGWRTVVDTRGTRVREPVERAWVTLSASTRAPDGQLSGVERVFAADRVSDLPTGAALAERMEAEADRLTAWRALPAETEPWAGPVIFEDQAAALLFRDVLLPRLQGTPEREPEDRGDSRVTVFGAGSGPVTPLAPQRRALPAGWRVVDDPTPGGGVGWTWDGEGTRGRAVTLVDDGVVREHLQGRTPSRWSKGSNGHGWSPYKGVAEGTPSHVTVTAPTPTTPAKLVKQGLKLARQVGRDHVLIVRSVSVRDPEGPQDESPLGAPAEVVRHYADGHEVPIRGVGWGGLDVRSLRDVVGAGPSATVDLVGRWDRLQRITAPSVLVEELELVPLEPGDRYEPRVPPPGAAR